MIGHVAVDTMHIRSELQRQGWCYVAGADLLAWLACPPSSWAAFAETWDDLDRDRFMGDGGRYRYRRHASFTLAAGATLARNAHRPHAQAVDFNRLNGGIERWFSPIAPPIADGPIMRGFVSLCTRAFALGAAETWQIEAHQFRIVTSEGMGKPTPEGLHRDGVDFVFISLIERHNVAGGVTRVVRPGRPERSHVIELARPGDSLFLDDTKVMHEVSPVHAAAEDFPGHRDVLVLTFAKSPL
jgi:hypothetical protein